MTGMQWFRRLLQRSKLQIPDPLWWSCVARLPLLGRLSPDELARLKSLSETLLATKTITGAGELELSDEIAVSIAAQACLLVLNLTLDLYDDMPGIIVYPTAFIVPHSETDEAGVVHEWREPLSGEAIHAGGAVVLSWEDMDSAQEFSTGHNLVIHEFAHKIDMDRGAANGCPPFLAQYHKNIDARRWQQVFSEAFTDFTLRIDTLERQLPDHFDPDNPTDAALYDRLCTMLPMDPYASRHPAEFFAVASETFFMQPQPLAAIYPEVYRLLARYYRQDPLAGAE
jgi:Mlc titration factor MtfA (ptsG expression regulator)